MPFDSIDYEVKCLTTKPENVRKLIAWLREGRGPEFDMSTIFSGPADTIPGRVATQDWCGTTACIAGHALILAWMDGDADGDTIRCMHDIWWGASPYLGVNDEVAFMLFGYWTYPCSIPEAVAKLEALLVPV